MLQKVCDPRTEKPLADIWDVNHWVALRRLGFDLLQLKTTSSPPSTETNLVDIESRVGVFCFEYVMVKSVLKSRVSEPSMRDDEQLTDSESSL